MRLSDKLVAIIKTHISTAFGGVNVYLFGSRADDNLIGGDIDLAIDTSLSYAEFSKKKSIFMAAMIRSGYDISMDIVQYPPENRLFLNEINANKIKL